MVRVLAPEWVLNFVRRSRAEETPFDPIIRHLLNGAVSSETGTIVLDVGANIGQSIRRLDRFMEQMKVHTFEPVSSCHTLLLDRFQGPNFVHNCVALSNTNGTKGFYELAKTATSSLLPPDLASSWASRKAEGSAGGDLDRLVVNRYEVPTMTLDSYVDNSEQLAGIRIHLLKMDTQGHEDKVLEGASNLLSDPLRRPLLIESEIILGAAYETHMNFIEIEQHLVPNGYRLVALDRSGNLLDTPDLTLNVLYASPELEPQIPR